MGSKGGCDPSTEHFAAAESHRDFHGGYREVVDGERGFQFLGNSGLVLMTFYITVSTLVALTECWC